MPNIGPIEILLVLVVILLIFGARRLPELGRSLGTGMREFKDSVTKSGEDDDDRPSLSKAPEKEAPEQDRHREPARHAAAEDEVVSDRRG